MSPGAQNTGSERRPSSASSPATDAANHGARSPTSGATTTASASRSPAGHYGGGHALGLDSMPAQRDGNPARSGGRPAQVSAQQVTGGALPVVGQVQPVGPGGDQVGQQLEGLGAHRVSRSGYVQPSGYGVGRHRPSMTGSSDRSRASVSRFPCAPFPMWNVPPDAMRSVPFDGGPGRDRDLGLWPQWVGLDVVVHDEPECPACSNGIESNGGPRTPIRTISALCYICAVTAVLNTAINLAVGQVFLLAAAGKLLDPRGASRSLAPLLGNTASTPASVGVGIVDLVVGASIITGAPLARATGIGVLVLYSVVLLIMRERGVADCGCFGRRVTSTIRSALTRNAALLALMTMTMITSYGHDERSFSTPVALVVASTLFGVSVVTMTAAGNGSSISKRRRLLSDGLNPFSLAGDSARRKRG